MLELASDDARVRDYFFLAGGTALSEFYLHHRLSEDLDFFSKNELNEKMIDSFIAKIAKDLNGRLDEKFIKWGFLIYKIGFKNEPQLKIDFVQIPFSQLESGVKYKKLKIASLWDILVDKLYTVFHRARARDFVDLYFGMAKAGCDIDQLRMAMEEKYEIQFDEAGLISRLFCVKDVSDFPKMLVPFDRKKMEDFFLKIVKGLDKRIFV